MDSAREKFGNFWLEREWILEIFFLLYCLMILQALFHINFISEIQLVVFQQADPNCHRLDKTKRKNWSASWSAVGVYTQPLLLLIQLLVRLHKVANTPQSTQTEVWKGLENTVLTVVVGFFSFGMLSIQRQKKLVFIRGQETEKLKLHASL